MIPQDAFTKMYRKLREKYQYWVDAWEESTDPSKFVYEDIGIAAYLLAVWEDERRVTGSEKLQTFGTIYTLIYFALRSP